MRVAIVSLPRRELAIEDHGDLELLTDQPGGRQDLRARRPALLLVAIDDRDDVESAYPRMQTLLAAQVHPLQHRASAIQKAPRQLTRRPGEREHAAVVIHVRVKVEKARRRKRLLDRLQRRMVAPLADIGNGEQHGAEAILAVAAP
jgi:hypothetical protein